MMDKIPSWVLCGAVVLAFCAGVLNTTALMGFTHISASHVTGNVSALAVAALSADWPNMKLFLISIASFWAGSVLSGFIVGGSELHINRNYGLAMYLEVALLALSLALYMNDSDFGQMMIAMACGLQNSMVTTYHGTVIRTTHLTGTTSDLGAMVGHWLADRKVKFSRVIVLSALWWSFVVGGFMAVVLYRKVGYFSMLLPMVIIFVAAVSYRHMEKWYDCVMVYLTRVFQSKNNP
ncbi:DUF1275 domain-containing protein [Moraxella haemolytica]|uniref:YoaK family protein n=1 Tax=Moraxella TaxID=475 RepID=UPI0025426ED7|nr:YoaK family protein [Moraxella sp. ZY171148]WII94511.1 DUF1275 domain-containing protein [Moraxella sp. ZY171148]